MKRVFRTTNKDNFFREPLLRNIFFVSVAIAVALPLYNVFFVHPPFTKMLTGEVRDDDDQARARETVVVSRLLDAGGGPGCNGLF